MFKTFAVRFRQPNLLARAALVVVASLGTYFAFPYAASVFAAFPVITEITTSNVSSTSATVSWKTDVVSNTQIEYGLTTTYGSSTTLNTSLVATHTQNLAGLQANQLYHYRVKSRDANNDLSTSGDRTFITTLGSTTAGTSTDSSNSNTMNATRFATGNGGKLASLSVNVGAVDTNVSNRSYQMAIYSANGNVPGNLVANTTTGTLVANTWNTLPITGTLAPNTGYFIVYNSNGSSSAVNNMRYTSGGVSGWSTGGRPFGTWPVTFGAFSSQSATFSMYASFISDSTPPTAAITSPAEGATLSGTATVTADVTDDFGVASVQFKLGGNNLGSEDTSAPYSVDWNTVNLLNGPQTLTVAATDSAGNVTTSSPVTVTVNNPPKVTITSPTLNQNISDTSVTVTYTKTGDWLPGDGKHAHFRLDGGPTKMDFDTDGNQSYTFTGVPGGNHTLEAIVANGSHEEQPDTGMSVSFLTNTPDTTAPTVSITAPAEGASVQNTITLSADATDDREVVGVQFLLDGSNLGSEDTSAPYTLSWNSTSVANGTHTISARARDSVNQTTSSVVTINVQNTDPRAVTGEWSSVMDWPLVTAHATLMHTGDILMWDAWESPTSNAKLWNPLTNVFTNVPVNAGLFCSGHATAADGKLVVMGGHTPNGSGIKNIMVFDPVTKTWSRKADMQYARWYPSVTQMPNNQMIAFSGQIVQGTFANTPEIYNPTTNISAALPFTTPQLQEIQYPQTTVLPSGKIMSISTEKGGVLVYNPATGSWTNTGTTPVPYGVWTSYAPGKYLITGGGSDFDSYDPGNPEPSQKTVRLLDMTNDTPAWSTAGNLNFARSFHNVTMLPTGKALAIGGSTTVNDFSTTGTQTAEQWDPTTNTWAQMASPSKPRMYHSISMLLPDGRVLSSGGGRLAPAPDQLNAQIYSPSYLFQGPRPGITSVPATIGHNSTMDVVTPNAADISKISFVSLASVTHTADWNQHFMELPFTRSGDTLTVNTPANANIAPENYYMVFAVNASGVPSEAKIVKLGMPDTTAPVVSNVQATGASSNSATITWTTDEISNSQVEYGATTSYGSSSTLDPNLVNNHSQAISGLSPDTTYNYRVKSRDGSNNLVTSNNFTFTTAALDTTAPAVSITAPTGGTVTNTVTLSANASDDMAVAGVQFRVDGTNAGNEDTSSPYSVSWTSNSVANGNHTITAVARDTSSNTTTSSTVTVNVQNTGTGGGLVGAWSFNEGTGATVSDTSGLGNIGSVFQATWYTAGKYGKALSFDGTNDYVSVPDSSSLDLTNKMTLEAWVRPTASSGWRTVMMKENSNEMAYGMYARESSNKPSAWLRINPTSGSSYSAGATPGLTLNAWTHLATTYDGTTLRLFINGVQRATRATTGNMFVTTGPLKFGGNAMWGEYFAGQLDEIRIYNRALSATEIQTDMNTAITP